MENVHERSPLWSVHSESAGRPMIRAWVKSKAEAEKLLEEMKGADPDATTTYWVVQLTQGEVAGFKHMGFIPNDA